MKKRTPQEQQLYEDKLELAKLLAEKDRRMSENVIKHMYPDTGKFRRELYAPHMKTFKAGKWAK